MTVNRLIPALLALTAPAGVALAQQSGPASAATASGALEEIVVTARKREETLLNVPLSVTALTAADLQAAAVSDVRDLSRLTPSFNFPDLGARYIDSPVIRGVGGNDADPTKQSASFFVDGVYVSGSITSLNLDDIQRVEVIKGPQSALFGRATFAGAINFITKAPTNDYEGRVTASAAQESEYEATVSHSGPIIADTLFYRVNGRYWKRGGEYRNAGIPVGLEIGDQSTWNVGASLAWQATDALKLRLRAELSNDDDGPAPIHKKVAADQNCQPRAVRTFCGPISFDPRRVGGVFDELIAEGLDVGVQRDVLRTSLQADWDFGAATLSGIAAYNDEDMQRPWDVTFDLTKNAFFVGFGGTRPGTNGAQIVNDWQFRDRSLELRLTSNGEGRFDWIVGAFTTELNQLFGRSRGSVTIDPPNRRRVKSSAVFAQAGYKLTDTVRVSAEGRYQQETLQRLNASTQAVLVLAGNTAADKKFSAFLPRVTVDWKPAQNWTLYGQYAEGNKPGDFNTATNVPVQFVVLDEEDLKAYELGAKASLLDGRLSAAFAVYKYELSNQQVRDVLPTFQILTLNTGASESKGAELELTWAATEGLKLRTALGYVDVQFTRNLNDGRSQTIFGNGNANGRSPRNAPAVTGAVSAEYEAPVGDSRSWFVRGDYSYRGKIYADETNLSWGEALKVANLRFGIKGDDWRAEIFGKNVFDADEPVRVGNATDFARFPAVSADVVSAIPVRGRQVGVRVSYDF